MIIEYHRPETVQEALKLLGRAEPITLPLGGGTILNQPSQEHYAVVDTQSLGLDEIAAKGNFLEVGAAVTLQGLLDTPDLPITLRRCIQLEATYNLRQMATIAGTLVSMDGRSSVGTLLLALDTRLHFEPGGIQEDLSSIVLTRPGSLRGRLITKVYVPLSVRSSYQVVSRTPADLPIVSAAVAQWPSGRIRIALGGFGSLPLLALDGPEPSGVEEAVRNAFQEASDEWASAQYRQQVAGVLAERALKEIKLLEND